MYRWPNYCPFCGTHTLSGVRGKGMAHSVVGTATPITVWITMALSPTYQVDCDEDFVNMVEGLKRSKLKASSIAPNLNPVSMPADSLQGLRDQYDVVVIGADWAA